MPSSSSPPPPPASSPDRASSSMAAGPRGDDVRRRDFMTLLGGTAVAWPLGARAQQKAMAVIGVLMPNPKVFATLTLEANLAELGWRSDRNLHLLFRSSDGANEALPALAADLVVQKVDLIFAAGDPATIAAQQASRT